MSREKFSKNLSSVSAKDILFIGFLSCVVLFSLILNSHLPKTFFSSPVNCLLVTFAVFLTVYGIWLFMLSKIESFPLALRVARVCMFPILILIFLLPYRFFYSQITDLQQMICFGIIGGGIIIFYRITTKPNLKPLSSSNILWAICGLYAIFFSTITVLHHLNYQDLSPPDVGLYSQIQWNNIHGRFFQSTTSGSNFVTHNSPFLIALAPFYALYAQPQTLMVLKICLLSFSAYPFFLIAKHFLDKRAALPITLGYLFFPFIIGQTFNAPHEVCYIPIFILFCFYFFIKNKFPLFIIFLLLSLSVKEHVALIAIMFGVYAFLIKKPKRWIMTPILLGLIWGIFSLWIIHYFQQIYHTDPYPAWLIENIKNRFMPSSDEPFLKALYDGLKTSNAGHWDSLSLIFLILLPLGIILPFFSAIWTIGAPELLINCLAVPMLFYPTWHYNVISSCFLLLSCIGTIKKISSHPISEQLKLPQYKIQMLMAWFLLICILCHFFLWSGHLLIKNNTAYVQTMDEASRIIPPDASLSLPKHLASHFSNRKDYFLLSDPRKGDFILLDDTVQYPVPAEYAEIFNKNRIRIFNLTRRP